MANDMTIEQISTVLNGIVKQATGSNAATVTDTSSFVTVANTALKAGFDPLATAISQVLSRTIFSVRPYTRKFGGIEVSNQRYGNHVRKITAVDKDFADDDRTSLTDGTSVDQYTVYKPEVLQTNFYGAETYQKSMTVYRDQLDVAFNSPDEFGSFINMMMGNASDMLEQARENTARATVANLVGGAIDIGNSGSVVHCLTEYNAANGGSSLTATTVMQSDNIVGFTKWLVARIQTAADMLTERSSVYHYTFGGKTVNRHTPYADQRLYVLSDMLNKIDAMTLSTIFHDEYLKIAYNEKVNFWQSIRTPNIINVTPGYPNAAGTTVTKGTAVNKPILAVLFDQEAAGYTVVNQWAQPTPFNARGGYYNMFWHETARYWNDFSENHVVFVLD